MESKASCVCCSIAAELGEQGAIHPMGENWTINARIGHLRPALIIQSRVHRADVSDLTTAELEDLGRVLSLATGQLEQIPGVEKVYACIWNENSPGHVHFHVIPRCGSDRDVGIGPRLEDVEPPDLRVDMDELAARISSMASVKRVESSTLVRLVLSACRGWSRVSLYRVFSGSKTRDGRLDGAEKYVLSWMAVWLAAFVFFGSSQEFRASGWVMVAPFVFLCAYRVLDMALFEMRIILQPSDFKSIPRGLLLRVFNLIEIMMCVGVLLQARTGHPPARALMEGFRTATVQTNFSQPGSFADGVLVVGSATSLLLLAGGVAMLLSKVAEQVGERRPA